MVLELGGKSPCIVDCDANIEVSARRIAWGKWINAGQTCIAPDYLFVHSSVKDRLLGQIKRECEKMYGADAQQSRFYGQIVSESAFDRLMDLVSDEDIYYGGESAVPPSNSTWLSQIWDSVCFSIILVALFSIIVYIKCSF